MSTVRDRSRRFLVLLALAGGAVALILAFGGSILAAALAGLLVAGTGLVVATNGGSTAPDPGRRRFLALVGGLGLILVAGGAAVGRAARRALRPDPQPTLEAMARDLGVENLELVRRQFHPDRSGDLQLVLAPYNSSNYANESRSLVKDDPRSSHASVWMYLERVPLFVYAPGIVQPFDSTDRVTLADLAPTTAHLMGFDGFRAPEGRVLPGIERPATPPKVVVTFVIDGGGWNVLTHWDGSDDETTSWPEMKRLMRKSGVYRNAIVGTFPAVTACAHATIGTGAYPRTHGITGHNVRYNGKPVKAWGEPGHADPSFLMVPTLAEAWNEATDDGAWVGELGYQIWHLGMLGRGGRRPLGDKPVAVLWDEDGGGGWIPQNPDIYRMPNAWPQIDRLDSLTAAYTDPGVDDEYTLKGKKAMCCTPPIIEYQGDLIASTFDSEPIGDGPNTSLLYINFKAPDYAGHVYNYLSLRQRFALQAVDREIARVARILEQRFAPGEFALIVTADHGQCPTVNLAGGVRLDPIQIQEDIVREFGDSLFSVVQSVVPSEIYLSSTALTDAGITDADIAAWLRDYRYGENIGPYVPPEAISTDRLDQRIFAAVLPASFLEQIATADLTPYGTGAYEADPGGVPPVTW
jgi:predicted AlkP superfamily pyrophosphatase or phosphodiesterase